MIIAIDFDGTCVTHSYPEIGEDIGAAPVLKSLIENGHQLILFTMRSDDTLIDAVKWFKDNEIPLFGINTNPDQKIWTNSPKAYAQLYIDDAALGCPLIHIIESNFDHRNLPAHERQYIDWRTVENMLISMGAIKRQYRPTFSPYGKMRQ